MKYYVPFRTLRSDIPSITLHKNSENFDTDDTGVTSNEIFFEEAYKRSANNFTNPPDLMIFDDAIFAKDLVKNFVELNDKTVSFQPATFIDNQGKYHEEYWIIKPTIYTSVIDLNDSKYELLSELDPKNLLVNTYDFEKIKIIGDLDPTFIPLIFIDPYLIELIIKGTFFNFIKDEQLKGFSFLELSKFEIHKMFEKNEEIINL